MSNAEEYRDALEEYERLIHLMLRARFQGDYKEEDRLEDIGDSVWSAMSTKQIEEHIHLYITHDDELKKLPPEYSLSKEIP